MLVIVDVPDSLMKQTNQEAAKKLSEIFCSTRKLAWEINLRWMKKKGAMISTTEIIAFRLLKEAGTEEFRKLS
ncbi:MAG: hypothetical protein ACXVAB_02470 [Thermodesulfobacteriota bacterium]